MEKPKRRIAQVTAFLIIAAFALIANSCSTEKKLPEWMVGDWGVQFTDYSVKESWQLKKDKLIGKTLWKGKFKNWEENISVSFNNKSKLVYATLIDGKSTNFVCENPDSDTLVFINNVNEFPKRVHYSKPVGNKMEVWIDNTDNDPNRIDFHFQKIK